jgi:4-amino-4-deoxy-L-arabinose transferase-like glycosyltransferase
MTRSEAAVVLAGALLLFSGLGARDLWEPDEPRHGAIAEEMRALGHGPSQLLLPRLNDEPYSQKPPLFHWLAALAGAPARRVTEGAARLPSALAGFATLLVVLRLARAELGAGVAVLGAAVLVTLPAFVDLARTARPDALLTASVTTALLFAWRLDRGTGSARANRRAMHLAIGLGILAKGPVAALLPSLGLAAWLAWERRVRDLRRFVSPDALLISLGPGLVWLAAVLALAPAGFFQIAVADNLFGRYFSGTDHERSPLFYLGQLPVSYLPWSLAWPLALWKLRPSALRRLDPGAASALRFLLAFVAAGLAFFSLSAGKRTVYLEPLYPALALLTAALVRAGLPAGGVSPRLARWLPVGGAAALGGLALWVHQVATWDGYHVPAGVAAWLVAAGIAALLPWEKALGGSPLAARGLVVAVALQLLGQVVIPPGLDPQRSIRDTAAAAAALAAEGTPIGLVQNGSLVGGVRYYAGRRVEPIGSAKGARRFLARGGRVLISESEHLPALDAVAPLRVAFRQEVSGDEMLVLVAEPPAP